MTTDIRGIRRSTDETRRRIAADLAFYRDRTKKIISSLNDDDLHLQHDSIMSPLVWDVGHVGNFEEFWLLREIDGRPAHDVHYDDMYNPFDNPRWTRGDLQLLDRTEAVDYIDEVRGDALSILKTIELDPNEPLLHDGYVFNIVIQHEAQHHETILQALDLRDNLAPYPLAVRPLVSSTRSVDDTARIVIDGGPFTMGTDDTTEAYDNERPSHEIEVDSFAIDTFPVTNRRYGEFIDADGYERSDLWTAEGWEWRRGVDVDAPQGWSRKLGGGWLVRRFGHVLDLDLTEPVQHVSFYEAEAFARFVGGRLPTEAEWEKAATWGPDATEPNLYPWGNGQPSASLANVGQTWWGPASVGAYAAGASAYGVEQMLGDVYEWTSSTFDSFPGFCSFPYAEYSEVFFEDHEYRVLRGASWATSLEVTRNTFRNWDYRARRQIFSGIRLAWGV